MFQQSSTGKDGSGSGFGSWKTVPAVPVPLSVSGKTVPVRFRFPVPVRFLSHPVLTGISLSEYSLEGFRVRLRRLSEYGFVAYSIERLMLKTQAEQYSDTVLGEFRNFCLSARNSV